jgi:hypothetical protein
MRHIYFLLVIKLSVVFRLFDNGRTTSLQSWSVESIINAVKAVIIGSIGYLKASKVFGFPQTALERRVKEKKRSNPSSTLSKPMGRCRCVFTPKQESELVSHIKNTEQRLLDFTTNEIRSLVFEICKANGCSNPFKGNSEIAGVDWLPGFLKRHPDISLRKPEATSVAQAVGFNKVAVSTFFLLAKVNDEYHLTPDKIYNVDETGITVNLKDQSKILVLKGRHRVGVLSSAKKGETATVKMCFSTSGAFMPPKLIFLRKRMQKEFQLNLPPGAWAEVHETGWMTKPSFCTWFQKFIEHLRARKESAVLLLLDGHGSHTKSLELINLGTEYGIILLCFPPHCTHRLQPLHVSFMKPFSLYYEEEVRGWLRRNPGKVVPLFQISILFGGVYLNAANMRTAVNGFRRTGIWPPDRNVSSDADFLPAATTNIAPPLSPHTAPCEKPSTSALHGELRQFVYQLMNLRHQLSLIRVLQVSFRSQKLVRRRGECHENGTRQ